MRRNSVFECIQEESELFISSFFGEAKHLKHLLLDIILVDSNTTTTDLVTIQYDIVCFCTDLSKISALDQRDIFIHQHGEWMVHCCVTVFFFVPLKKRELCYPYETIFILIKKIHLFCKFYTESSENIVYNFVLVCCKEKQVPRLTFHSLNKCIHLFFCHKFGERRFAGAVFCDRDVSKTFCAISLCKLNEFVDLLTRHAALAFCVDTTNTSAVLKRTCEHTKSAAFYDITDIMKFHTETHIRLVGTKTIHSFLPGNSLDRKFYIDIQDFFEQECKESLIYVDDIINIYERKLHIDLRKFRLTVRTKVLITEAACDLDITVISRAHQKLFVKLRRLWKSVERTWMDSGRNKVISCTFRCTLTKHWCLNFKESFVCEEFTGEHHNFALHHQISLKVRSSQVKVTVFQTDLVFCLAVFLDRERRNIGLCQDS